MAYLRRFGEFELVGHCSLEVVKFFELHAWLTLVTQLGLVMGGLAICSTICSKQCRDCALRLRLCFREIDGVEGGL